VYCNKCGAPANEDFFCSKCGSRFYPQAETPSVPRTSKPSKKTRLILFSSLGIAGLWLVAVAVVVKFSEHSFNRESSAPPEIQVRQIASAHKAQVERVLGVPSRYEICCSTDNLPKFDIAYYPWGDINYDENGVAVDILYHYKDRAHSLSTALATVGLQKTSEPIRVADRFYRWCPSCVPPSPALSNGDSQFAVTVYDAIDRDGFDSIEIVFLSPPSAVGPAGRM